MDSFSNIEDIMSANIVSQKSLKTRKSFLMFVVYNKMVASKICEITEKKLFRIMYACLLWDGLGVFDIQ